MIDKLHLRQTIRAGRERLSLTQAELAARLSLTPQTVSKWEKGLSLPDLPTLSQLAAALALPLTAFLAEEKETESLLAIDGGGSKTEFLHFNKSGEVLARQMLGGSNPNTVGVETAVRILTEGINACGEEMPRTIYASVSGCSIPENRKKLTAALTRAFPGSRITVESDIMGVLFAAEHTLPAMAGILGTGSSVCGYDGSKLMRHGGWGPLLGDACSGYALGREALRLTLAAEEGTAPASALSAAVQTKFGGKLTGELHRVYLRGGDYIASFAPLVLEAVRAGDAAATDILDTEVKEYCRTVHAAAKELTDGKADGTPIPLILAGGLTHHADLLLPRLCAALGEGICPVIPEVPPILGACRRAMVLENADSPAFFAGLKKNYERMRDHG